MLLDWGLGGAGGLLGCQWCLRTAAAGAPPCVAAVGMPPLLRVVAGMPLLESAPLLDWAAWWALGAAGL